MNYILYIAEDYVRTILVLGHTYVYTASLRGCDLNDRKCPNVKNQVSVPFLFFNNLQWKK